MKGEHVIVFRARHFLSLLWWWLFHLLSTYKSNSLIKYRTYRCECACGDWGVRDDRKLSRTPGKVIEVSDGLAVQLMSCVGHSSSIQKQRLMEGWEQSGDGDARAGASLKTHLIQKCSHSHPHGRMRGRQWSTVRRWTLRAGHRMLLEKYSSLVIEELMEEAMEELSEQLMIHPLRSYWKSIAIETNPMGYL